MGSNFYVEADNQIMHAL